MSNYGGKAAIDRMKERLEQPTREALPDPGRAFWVEQTGPHRMMTHYVGDDCEPDGHVKEMRGRV